jgi:transposase-like protein
VRRPRRYDDKDLLTELYVERGMTIAEIARELHATSVTIQKYLKKHGVPARGRGPRKGRSRIAPGTGSATPSPGVVLSEEELAQLLHLADAATPAPEPRQRQLLGDLRKRLQQA